MKDLTAALYQTFKRGRQRGHRDAIEAARRLFPASDVDALITELASPETSASVAPDDRPPPSSGVGTTGADASGVEMLT